MGRSGQHVAARAGEDPQLERRIRDGLAFAITDRGYLATTVADIARQARVPVSVVYELYGDKEACFLAFYRHT
ncbi:MAG: helix-turn-helix domain-containing protein, partial [Baekduiaceae bacterium]